MGTTRLKSRRRQDQGSKWVRVLMAILATIGVIDTGSITMTKWGWIGSIACPGGTNGCSQVLDSNWGTILLGNELSIPLSFLGFLGYFTILTMAILPLIPGISERKSNISLRTWWGLFATSCGMAVFSLLLMGIMVFKIEAFCFFCVISALISIFLLILSLIGGRWDEPDKLIFRGILISIFVLLGGLVWSSSVDPSQAETIGSQNGVPPIVINQSNRNKIELAKHIQSRGGVMYSAYWCPHCHDQKEMFGKEAVEKLSIIECAKDGQNNKSDLCERKGVNAYPSWEINGKIESGVKSLEELAEISGYKSRDFD